MSLLRRSGQVLALQFVLQSRGLVQVPFLTRMLSVEEFGALTLATTVAGAGTVLALLGLHTGLFLNYVRLEGPRTRSALTTVLVVALPVIAVASVLLTLFMAVGGANQWFRSIAPLAGVLGLLIAASALRELAAVVPRALQDVGFHGAHSLLANYGGFALGLALVFRGYGPRGFLLGLGLGTLAGALWALSYSFRHSEGPMVFDRAFGVLVARSAVPVVPLALAQQALFSLDYLYVTRFAGPGALATYGLAYALASPVMLAVAAINFTLLPEYVSRQKKGDAEFEALVERLMQWGWFLGLLIVAATVAIGPPFVVAFAGPLYRETGNLLPSIASAYVLFVLSQILHVVRSARLADVSASAAVAVACAILSAVLGIWLIPAFGARAAAAITLLSFLVYFLGMTAAVRPILKGRIAGLLPVAPLLGLATLPLLSLLDPSLPVRVMGGLALAGVAASRLSVLRPLRENRVASAP